ncbi:MAG: sigma-54-dependent Fis family transcriptional regulator [Deltaproteobacteria bacterium]|nr:sigma-54-dependent Fis family transcriptional regulator [Deltaproteobacteria bacterium]
MTPERKQLLVADDETNLRRVLTAALESDGYEVHAVADGQAAMDALKEHHLDVVITDLRMPVVDGLGLLQHCAEHYPNLPVILITAYGTVETAVGAMRRGAFDYISKPFDLAEIRAVVAKALRTGDLRTRDVILSGGDRARYKIIGNDAAMTATYDILEKVADTPATVLITGESGTGKELIARALHDNSARRDHAFIRVNCGAIPRDLMEAELFGYERGAFTGAVNSKPGRFELAHGGTLFLDEIAEIPVEMQVKLLRAIQEGEIDRVGCVKPTTVSVRLVAATNRDLKREIAAGRFREDLYYRLNVVPIHLPPLRERRSDIPLLIQHFLETHAARFRRPALRLAPEVRACLESYPWPGNIRELENVLERCVLLADGDTIRLRDLPPEVREGSVSPEPGEAVGAEEDTDSDSDASGPGGLKERVREATARLERELIVKALAQTGTNVTQTARLLKISRKSLQIKMKELGLREGNG